MSSCRSSTCILLISVSFFCFFSERLITPAVAFNVKDAVTTSPAYQDIIRFEHVLLNEAGAYDRVIGIFTAPANGTYLFGAQVCSTSSKFGWFEIAVDAKENVILCISDYENQTGHTSTSGTAVTKLNKGQRVWVQNRRSQTTLYNAVACWNQFMGVLIHI